MDTLPKNLSYFRSNLQELLNINFPEKAYDLKFISQRSNWAFKTYQGAIRGGNSEEESERIANSILFESLYFSKFSIIHQVVTYEFDTFFVDEEIRPFSLKMLNVCENLFKKYDLTDDFAYSTDSDCLYNDIKATISEWITKNLNL